jgi:nucleoside-diphosphate-sugar epimerase
VRANLLGAASPRKLTGEVVNVAGGRRIALNDLCREIGRVMGREVAVEHVAPRAGDIRHSLADISRAEELLGYKPLVRWEDGIGPTLAYLQTLRTKGPAEASKHMTSGRLGKDFPGVGRGAT